MSKPKGGWEKLKESQKKKESEAQLLKKVNPLTSYYKIQNTNNKVDTIINEPDLHVVSSSNSFTDDCSNSNAIILNSNDPGVWDLTSTKLKSYVLEKGPTFLEKCIKALNRNNIVFIRTWSTI